MRFFRTPALLPFLYPSLTWRIPTQEKVIYLTFDDGPIPGPTQFVLSTLKQFDARATFFCIGDNVRKHPDVFREIIQNGHGIGNHTYHHMNGWKTATDIYVANVELCHREMAQRVAHPGKLFRPPFGRIKHEQRKALRDKRIVMWDVLTFDYDRSLDEEKCLRGSLAATRPGSIVVFHDSLKAAKNLRFVLPRFIEHFSKQGYSFSSLK